MMSYADAMLVGMTLDNAEIGMFLGGLLSYVVRRRADELGLELSEDDAKSQRPRLLSEAFESVLGSFPEPLRSKMQADRDNFLAAMLQLN